ncbi:MAG: pyridoxal-dependent decarboxylase, exosortase A system-associated [Gammaproteobacteria bacterium]|nr:pyridoxal-dependent decarboxylase, exosortase A system-associated [Gammaproteobacteria bacterium]
MSTIEFDRHSPITCFDVQNNDLVIGGHTVSELATRADGLAFYAYDRSIMAQKVAQLREHFPRSVKLHFAIKANPMPELVAHMASLVDGLDVASGRELEVAAATQTPRHEISFAGPGKQTDELRLAITKGIVINCESATELERIDGLAADMGFRPKVALRVNPDFQLQNSGMKMAGGPQQFGIDAEQVPAVLSTMQYMHLDFHGFHIFSGSQNLRADAIIESQNKACELAVRLARFAPSPVRMLNIGGGLGVPYFPNETPLDIEPIGASLNTLSAAMQQQLPQADLVVELGRYLVAESGIYVCRITDKKVSRGQIFLICNGGLHHHLAASGNFGQVLRKNYPVAIGTKMQATSTATASVVGPLCTPLDLLAAKMTLAEADIDDLVVVFQSGAYGYTASPQYFLSHPAPREFLV